MPGTRLLAAGVGIVGTVFALFLARKFGIMQVPVIWHDSPMHFSGGLGWGFLGLWLAVLAKADSPRQSLKWALWTAFIVGLIWEIVVIAIWAYLDSPLPYGHAWDTSIDMVMDTLGGLVAWLIVHVHDPKWWHIPYMARRGAV
jgi:hypothetical protein